MPSAETSRSQLTSRKDSGVVWNWRASGRLPPNTFFILTSELEKRGLSAPPAIWGMVQPERAA